MLFRRAVPVLLLLAVIAGTFFVASPTLDYNIQEPNLITYFNHDEGLLMDIAWYYYSGEKRESFQFETDYGIELLYIASFAKGISRMVHFTPGTFVLMLRWLNLLFWIASLLALWCLVRRHFGGYWLPFISVVILAVRPAFPLLCKNSKPDSMILFLMIVGLDYILRLTEKPSMMNFYISVACASLATLIKYEGIFLLPALVIAMYCANRVAADGINLFPNFKIAWVSPAIMGAAFIALPALLISLYVRQSTGLTWYAQFGLLRSLSKNVVFLFSVLSGTMLIIFSIILRVFGKSEKIALKKVIGEINKILSYAILAVIAYLVFTIIFGFGWLSKPMRLIDLMASTGPDIFVTVRTLPAGQNLLLEVKKNLIGKISDFDAIIFSLFIFSLVMELWFRHRDRGYFRLKFSKRIVLIIFMLPLLLFMISMMRMMNHHMLPFFAASILLLADTMGFVYLKLKNDFLKRLAIGTISILLILDIFQNGKIFTRSFAYMYRWREDVIFDIVKWWRNAYPPATPIVADHPMRIYLPREYKNVKYLKYQHDKTPQLRDLVNSFRPRLIYLNTWGYNVTDMPPVETILPGVKVRLVATFDGAGKYYKRYPDARYVVYEVLY